MQWVTERFNDSGKRDPEGLNFRCHSNVEMGTKSLVVDRLWLRFNVAFGSATYKIVTAHHGTPGGAIWDSGNRNTEKDNDYMELTDVTQRMVTIMGTLDNPGACPVPGWVPLAH